MCELYRHFDSKGRLLYVGISLSAIARLAAHRKSANWFNSIAWIEVEKFVSRHDALIAETHAIRTENPIWNKAGKLPGSNRRLLIKRRPRKRVSNPHDFSPKVEAAYRELMGIPVSLNVDMKPEQLALIPNGDSPC